MPERYGDRCRRQAAVRGPERIGRNHRVRYRRRGQAAQSSGLRPAARELGQRRPLRRQRAGTVDRLADDTRVPAHRARRVYQSSRADRRTLRDCTRRNAIAPSFTSPGTHSVRPSGSGTIRPSTAARAAAQDACDHGLDVADALHLLRAPEGEVGRVCKGLVCVACAHRSQVLRQSIAIRTPRRRTPCIIRWAVAHT